MMDRFVLSQGARNRTELGVVGVLTGRSARRRGPDSQSAGAAGDDFALPVHRRGAATDVPTARAESRQVIGEPAVEALDRTEPRSAIEHAQDHEAVPPIDNAKMLALQQSLHLASREFLHVTLFGIRSVHHVLGRRGCHSETLEPLGRLRKTVSQHSRRKRSKRPPISRKPKPFGTVTNSKPEGASFSVMAATSGRGS